MVNSAQTVVDSASSYSDNPNPWLAGVNPAQVVPNNSGMASRQQYLLPTWLRDGSDPNDPIGYNSLKTSFYIPEEMSPFNQLDMYGVPKGTALTGPEMEARKNEGWRNMPVYGAPAGSPTYNQIVQQGGTPYQGYYDPNGQQYGSPGTQQGQAPNSAPQAPAPNVPEFIDGTDPDYQALYDSRPDVQNEYQQESTRDAKSVAYLKSLGIENGLDYTKWWANKFGVQAPMSKIKNPAFNAAPPPQNPLVQPVIPSYTGQGSQAQPYTPGPWANPTKEITPDKVPAAIDPDRDPLTLNKQMNLGLPNGQTPTLQSSMNSFLKFAPPSFSSQSGFAGGAGYSPKKNALMP